MKNQAKTNDEKAIGELDPSLLGPAMDSAKEALKSLLLINGAATVALLTFIGHLVTQGHYHFIEAFVPPVVSFVIGIALVPLAHGFSYKSNLLFAKSDSLAKSFRSAAIATAFISLFCFVVGACLAVSGFSLLSKYKPNGKAAVIQEVK